MGKYWLFLPPPFLPINMHHEKTSIRTIRTLTTLDRLVRSCRTTWWALSISPPSSQLLYYRWQLDGVDFEVLAARANIQAWDVIGTYTLSATMGIPQLHDALQEVLGDHLQRDIAFWNSIIDEVCEEDSHARYLALRGANVMDMVSTSSISNTQASWTYVI